MQKIPTSFKKYFWDFDFSTINISLHSFFVIERLIQVANWTVLKWVFSNFTHLEIKNVLNNSKSIHPEIKNFCSIILSK